jgi:phospholipase A1
VDAWLKELSPKEKSVLEKKMKEQQAADNNPIALTLYRPTYIQPFYYTGQPYYAIYQGNTPNNQNLMHNEFKAQLSLMTPIITNLFRLSNTNLDLAYTQVNFWQVYAESQYFRETNYEPEIFIENHFRGHWLWRLGFDHQSNGRGGVYERSWNRGVFNVQYGGSNWLLGVKTWALLFAGQTSDLHNPDILHYLGHENILFSHKVYDLTASLQVQNIESGLHRGFVAASLSYPLSKRFSLYTEYFNGYGQSLIEYNHRTQSGSIGFAFNDWI